MESGLRRTPYIIRTNNIKDILRKDSVDHSTAAKASNEPAKLDETLLDSHTASTNRSNHSELGATPETKISELLLSEMPAVNKQDEILSPFKWDLSNASSEHPSPSPIFNDNLFLPERIDDLPTDFLRGISNINYDFNIFLENAERSISDESIDTKLKLEDAAAASSSNSAVNVDEFDPLKNAGQSPVRDSSSIIDRPVPPMQATTLEYMGFSHFEIPTISCSTGADNLIADEFSQGAGASLKASTRANKRLE